MIKKIYSKILKQLDSIEKLKISKNNQEYFFKDYINILPAKLSLITEGMTVK